MRFRLKRRAAEDVARAERERVEAEAYADLARDVLAAVAQGADVSFLWSCPDLTAFAMERRR